MRTTSSLFVFSMVRRAVISFVRLAMGNRLSSLREKRVSPVFPSTSRAADAFTLGGEVAAVADWAAARERSSPAMSAKRRSTDGSV